ncbi:MAG: signal recognition particle-docking protein FtsY [Candidatus Aenigmarchaeota archaeon]|nr:signal recognition particle-docking protein FtsY [Candidatus Aenigmarchaeota archaeon]
MFGLLKKKLSKVVESISDKLKKKDAAAEKIEEVIEQAEDKKPEEILEQIEPVKEEIPEIIEEIKSGLAESKKKPEETKSIFKKIKEKIKKTLVEKTLTEKDLLPILDALEVDLIEADVAVEVVVKIKQSLIESLAGKEIKKGKDKEIVASALRESLLKILDVKELDLEELIRQKKPLVLLFLGFNGSGKTTSLAKFGKMLKDKGYTCVFAACDTFRAASIEQLEEHAGKIGVKIIKHKYGADPAAVLFDAIAHAKANNVDVVLADTAGRAHTNRNLMEQMQKIVRVNKPDLKILVIDSLTGNDAITQARIFNEAGVDASIFTKVDVNEKGGAILSVTYELSKPILFLGLGQEYNDLEKFDKEKFVSSLLGENLKSSS